MANLAPTWVTKAGLGVLTLNSGLAIYRARDDPASILFVSGAYTTLLLLFCCLRDYERAAPRLPGEGAGEAHGVAAHYAGHRGLRRFAWNVALVMHMPSAVAAAIVWALAVATNAVSALFVPGGVAAHHAAHHGLRVGGGGGHAFRLRGGRRLGASRPSRPPPVASLLCSLPDEAVDRSVASGRVCVSV